MPKKSSLDWSPPGPLERLKKIAPSIAFSVEHTPDPDFMWDGDGPDPADEGYVAYDVDVVANAIVDGEIVEGRSSLGGLYDKPDDVDPDVHGYLLQMLQEAVKTFDHKLSGALLQQAEAASNYLDDRRRRRYEAHRPRST